jgi:hypothetical protein
MRILELLHVGDVAAGLGAEHEIRGHRIAPLVNDARLGQVVETVVDFHG